MTEVEAATAQHVARTLRALELVAEAPQTQASLARALAVHRRTARRLLARLVEEGYAEAAQAGRHVSYAATPRLAVLGRQVAEQLDVVAIASRHSEVVDENVADFRFVAVPGPAGISLPFVERPTPGGPGDEVSLPRRGPLHATAAGKVFLSTDTTLVGDLLNQELLAYTPKTLVTRADLLLELASVSRRGYAIEDGEYRMDLRTVASGVVNHTGRTIAALGATPAPGIDLIELAGQVREAALACSREIGAVVGDPERGAADAHDEQTSPPG